MMKICKEFLTYEITKEVVAFTSRRGSGVTKNAYSPIATFLSLPDEKVIIPHQTHSDNIQVIDNHFFSLSSASRKNFLEGVDAEITNMSEVCICVSTADCIPVLLYDSENKALAAIHAGWKGTARGIVMKTIKKMQLTYGTSLANLYAVIGPGISMKNFEVGNEVYDMFQMFHREVNIDNTSCTWFNSQTGKWHINLSESNRQQLLRCGVLSSNIFLSNICTYDNTAHYFSARHDGLAAGRMVSGVCRIDMLR